VRLSPRRLAKLQQPSTLATLLNSVKIVIAEAGAGLAAGERAEQLLVEAGVRCAQMCGRCAQCVLVLVCWGEVRTRNRFASWRLAVISQWLPQVWWLVALGAPLDHGLPAAPAGSRPGHASRQEQRATGSRQFPAT
jgi:hypothetical protein